MYTITPRKDQVPYGVGGWLMAASEIAGLYQEKDLATCEKFMKN